MASPPAPRTLRGGLAALNDLQRHRGPDGCATWTHPAGLGGLAHRRLSIIDLVTGDQPMTDGAGNWIAFCGEIYNYRELRDELGPGQFRTGSDTEVILHAYRRWGPACVEHLRGMFSFALWDEARGQLFCARDRFGIKPFYYAVVDDVLHFATEAKALLPFLPRIETDVDGLKDYLTFQFCLDGKTLFNGVRELLPGDVPLGAYVSGGIDSSAVASLAQRHGGADLIGFTGRFDEGPAYDETEYARELARCADLPLFECRMTEQDFVDQIGRVIYHLDYPVAGPGSFPQFLVSRLAAGHRKVVLGGQGGDEIFGGYVRYLVAYFEQCIRAAIDGTAQNGNFIVTYESIIPNLGALRQYKPMLQEFWREGLFEDLDRRYFRLVNRAPTLGDEVNWPLLGDYSPYETFRTIFRGQNVAKESYFDSMTHFDFKTLLPALLQVEDRMAMAHGLESRVPFLDHPLVEFAATAPSNVKFKSGEMKHILKRAVHDVVPPSILARTDKMGFPVPLGEWLARPGPAREFVVDTLSTSSALARDLIDNRKVLRGLDQEPKFGRKTWGLLSLELWQQTFHDRAAEYRKHLSKEPVS
jgi:asparagine synthase (glutamine-hydrolysing)